jgi:hypothetical protein
MVREATDALARNDVLLQAGVSAYLRYGTASVTSTDPDAGNIASST